MQFRRMLKLKWEYISTFLRYNATYDAKYLELTLGSAKMKKQTFQDFVGIPYRLRFGMTFFNWLSKQQLFLAMTSYNVIISIVLSDVCFLTDDNA